MASQDIPPELQALANPPQIPEVATAQPSAATVLDRLLTEAQNLLGHGELGLSVYTDSYRRWEANVVSVFNAIEHDLIRISQGLLPEREPVFWQSTLETLNSYRILQEANVRLEEHIRTSTNQDNRSTRRAQGSRQFVQRQLDRVTADERSNIEQIRQSYGQLDRPQDLQRIIDSNWEDITRFNGDEVGAAAAEVVKRQEEADRERLQSKQDDEPLDGSIKDQAQSASDAKDGLDHKHVGDEVQGQKVGNHGQVIEHAVPQDGNIPDRGDDGLLSTISDSIAGRSDTEDRLDGIVSSAGLALYSVSSGTLQRAAQFYQTSVDPLRQNIQDAAFRSVGVLSNAASQATRLGQRVVSSAEGFFAGLQNQVLGSITNTVRSGERLVNAVGRFRPPPYDSEPADPGLEQELDPTSRAPSMDSDFWQEMIRQAALTDQIPDEAFQNPDFQNASVQREFIRRYQQAQARIRSERGQAQTLFDQRFLTVNSTSPSEIKLEGKDLEDLNNYIATLQLNLPDRSPTTAELQHIEDLIEGAQARSSSFARRAQYLDSIVDSRRNMSPADRLAARLRALTAPGGESASAFGGDSSYDPAATEALIIMRSALSQAEQDDGRVAAAGGRPSSGQWMNRLNSIAVGTIHNAIKQVAAVGSITPFGIAGAALRAIGTANIVENQVGSTNLFAGIDEGGAILTITYLVLRLMGKADNEPISASLALGLGLAIAKLAPAISDGLVPLLAAAGDTIGGWGAGGEGGGDGDDPGGDGERKVDDGGRDPNPGGRPTGPPGPPGPPDENVPVVPQYVHPNDFTNAAIARTLSNGETLNSTYANVNRARKAVGKLLNEAAGQIPKQDRVRAFAALLDLLHLGETQRGVGAGVSVIVPDQTIVPESTPIRRMQTIPKPPIANPRVSQQQSTTPSGATVPRIPTSRPAGYTLNTIARVSPAEAIVPPSAFDYENNRPSRRRDLLRFFPQNNQMAFYAPAGTRRKRKRIVGEPMESSLNRDLLDFFPSAPSTVRPRFVAV